MDLLMRLNQNLHKTVIVVTHSQSLVDHYKQRVITIEDGEIKSDKIGGMFDEEV